MCPWTIILQGDDSINKARLIIEHWTYTRKRHAQIEVTYYTTVFDYYFIPADDIKSSED